MKTRSIVDRGEILSFLKSDRLYAAYAIGDLNAQVFPMCQWAVAESDAGPCALAMTLGGLMTPALFVMGDGDGIAALLRRTFRQESVQVTMRPEHFAGVSSAYSVSGDRRMFRMAVDGASFRPLSAPVTRLDASHLDELNTLYAWGGQDYFASYQLEQGVYYAIEADGSLVAAAGTHVVAREYGMAAVGNVYTHPDYRSRGFAAACTSAVVAELLDLGCRSVVLNVRQDNAPAVRAYGKLGFGVHCPFIESPGQRKSSLQQMVYGLTRLPARRRA